MIHMRRFVSCIIFAVALIWANEQTWPPQRGAAQQGWRAQERDILYVVERSQRGITRRQGTGSDQGRARPLEPVTPVLHGWQKWTKNAQNAEPVVALGKYRVRHGATLVNLFRVKPKKGYRFLLALENSLKLRERPRSQGISYNRIGFLNWRLVGIVPSVVLP